MNTLSQMQLLMMFGSSHGVYIMKYVGMENAFPKSSHCIRNLVMSEVSDATYLIGAPAKENPRMGCLTDKLTDSHYLKETLKQ